MRELEIDVKTTDACFIYTLPLKDLEGYVDKYGSLLITKEDNEKYIAILIGDKK
jgi:hypothetical protein